MRAGETKRGGDSRLDRTRLNSFLIIDAYEPATAPPGRGDSCMDHRAQTVPILHTGSVKSANQLSFSGAFRQVCRNCTGTLFLPPNDRQISLCDGVSTTGSRLVGRRSGQIEERHRRCSTEHRMSVGLRGSFDAGGLLCRTNRHTQSRRGHPCRPQ